MEASPSQFNFFEKLCRHLLVEKRKLALLTLSSASSSLQANSIFNSPSNVASAHGEFTCGLAVILS